jgi:outer membrane immunogenic protein
MQKPSLTVVAFFALIAPATAADLPLKAPPYIPPVTWTGFYVGGNLGYSWGHSNASGALTDPGSGLANSGTGSFHPDGVIGGGQIGYNYQINNWVIGLETDFQGSAQRSRSNFAVGAAPACTDPANAHSPACMVFGAVIGLPGVPVTGSVSERLNWFGTLRGRLGWAITPTILPYVTGGLAYGERNLSLSVSGVNGVTPVSAVAIR